MKKLITVFSAVLMTLSVSSQKVVRERHLLSKTLQKRELSDTVSSKKYFKYLPQRQNVAGPLQFKNAEAAKQRLNSVYAAEQDRDEYRYDSQGNVVEDIYYVWDTDHWGNVTKDEFTNDSHGNNTLSMSYIWKGSAWENDEAKEEYTYDDNGNLIQHINSVWVDNQYLNSEKNTYTYDNNGNKTQEISYSWDGGVWTNSWKEEFVFDDKEKLAQIINYYGDGSQWVNSDKSDFIYDISDQLTEIVSSDWDGNDWIESEKYENSYDSNGNISHSYYSYWEAEQWEVLETINYAYDSKGNMTLFEISMTDFTIYKEESVYDDFGNRTENSFFNLNWETQQLEKSWKTEYTYDNGFSFEDLILPLAAIDENEIDGVGLELMFKHKLMQLTDYVGAGETWEFDSNYLLEYSDQGITGIGEENSETRMSLYPNPANNLLSIETGISDACYIEITSLNGKSVFSGKMQGPSQQLDLSSFPKGVYLVTLRSEEMVEIRKLIKL